MKTTIWVIVLITVGLILWFVLSKPKPTVEAPKEVKEETLGGSIFEKVEETASNPAEKIPETNPFKEVETNPYKGGYTNPFGE